MSTATSPSESPSPPKPPLAFRVGVVGHRPNRLGAADLVRLGEVLQEVLGTVRDEVGKVAASLSGLFAPAPPVLRAVSPLAEGTNRIFAEQAISLGYELCCVMPFPQPEYEKDFLPGTALEADSLARFRGILESASGQGKLTLLELDGSRGDEGKAYGTGGSVVLGLSDLLIAVWDGDKDRDKQGGTAGTMAEAQRAKTPVVLVDAQAPHAWRLLGSSENDLAALRKAVADALAVPITENHESSQFAHQR